MESYEVLDILGEGTYGVVLKARNRATGKLVAIKRFKQTEQDEHVRKTSSREVRMLQLLRHPNILRLEDVFRKDGKLYLVFEFIDHTILKLLESTTHGLSHRELRRYTYQLLRGIEFCHKNNVIHRDVKPENVLINESGLLKLCDFGFARQLSSKGKYTDYVATRWYRAPELLVGDVAYGKPVDVWAIGCMFAELSDGQPLFPGESDLDQLCLILQTCGPVPPRMVFIFEHNPLYNGISFPHTSIFYTLKERYHRESDDWLEFLSACLKTDPAQRLTCTELMELPYFTRDGFRERYEAELRAATGLPPLRSTSMLSAPSPTRRHAPNQTTSTRSSLRPEAVVSLETHLSSDRVSPKLQGPQLLAGNEGSSDVHLPKATLEANVYDTSAYKHKVAGVSTSTLSPVLAPTSDASLQLPMLTTCNSEKAIVAALADHFYRKSPSSSTAIASMIGANTTEVAGGMADAVSLASSHRAVPPLQGSSVLLSPISNRPTLRARKGRQNSGAANQELSGRRSPRDGGGPEGVVSAQGNKGELLEQTGPRQMASATLPPSEALEWVSESTTGNALPSLRSHGVADSHTQVMLTTPASRKGFDDMTALANGATKLVSPKELAVVAAATPTYSSLSIAPICVSSAIEDLQDLSKSSFHFPRHAEQHCLPSQPSAETSLSSSRACTRNPLTGPSLEKDVVGRSKSNSELAESSLTRTHHGPSGLSSSMTADELKKAKLTMHKKDAHHKHGHAALTHNCSSLDPLAPEHATGAYVCSTGVTLMANPLREGTLPSHSHAQRLPQSQHLVAPEPGKKQAVHPQMHDAGPGPYAPGLTHSRNIDAHGPLSRKERRSKPLPGGSTAALQGGDSRHRPQPQKRQDGGLLPGDGSSQRAYHRATATLLALSALRNISVPPPAKSTGGADKYSFNNHVILNECKSGGDAVSSVLGGNGVGTKTLSTSRARRPLGMYTLFGKSRGNEGVEASRRARRKSVFLTSNQSRNGAAGFINCPDNSITPSSHNETGIVRGALYHPFKNSKVCSEVLRSQSRQSLRKPKKKMGDTRGSGPENTTVGNSSRPSSTTGLLIQDQQQQLAKEEGGDGGGTARRFSAATAAAPYSGG
ncbi:hypothetical protein JKF63_02695 [Porcisia hertigi]|uniref:cyclin-dependent kinase n=1 Tax=Porcisia hertigi TaxID=2761500 RepID=A0A836IK62_9TRYP|nr:hypothetical protein JKF63_02695 [Porcisia hertigi]